MYPSKSIHVVICGPIGTKLGTHMQIHLEKVVGKIKKLPRVTQGEFGGFRGSEIENVGNLPNARPISTKFGTHMRIHLGMNIG